MKKIINFMLMILMINIFVSCSRTDVANTSTVSNTTTKTEIKEVGIEVGYHQNEVAYYQTPYQPTYLFVLLKLDDGNKVDITTLATYDIDTNLIGEVTGYARYKNYSAPIRVNVEVPKVKSIRITNTDNYKIFNVGDTFDSNNITILAQYTSGFEGRILSFGLDIYNYAGILIDKNKPFETPGDYIVRVSLNYGNEVYRAEYNIIVNNNDESQFEVFTLDDNLLDIHTNYNFNEVLYTDLFYGDFLKVEVIGELNGIKNIINDEYVSAKYDGKEYNICLNITSATISTTKDSVKFTVNTDIKLEMIVNASSENTPYLSLDYLRTKDIIFEGNVGENPTLISVELSPGTYYLGHELNWLNIYEIKAIAL